MTHSTTQKTSWRLGIALAALIGFSPETQAQSSFTWTSFANGNWSSNANWSPGAPPSQNTTDLFFTNGILDVAYTATNDLASPFLLHSMTFGNHTGSALIIAGNAIQLAGANPFI